MIIASKQEMLKTGCMKVQETKVQECGQSRVKVQELMRAEVCTKVRMNCPMKAVKIMHKRRKDR